MSLKPFDQLTIMNDFLFSTVMRKEEFCKPLLEYILKVKIRKLDYLNQQQEISAPIPDSKSIRLDVYVEDDQGTVYDLEVQTTDKRNLPRRTRFYQSLIDARAIEKGADYKTLKKSFVIFICSYDPFHNDRMIYTFRNRCDEEPDVLLDDDAYKIFIYTKGTKGDISDELKEVIHYMDTGIAESDYTKALDAEVESVKSDEKWRMENMTVMENYARERYLARTELLISQIRNAIGKLGASQMAEFFRLSEANCEETIQMIQSHPDWDDEQIAEEVSWQA